MSEEYKTFAMVMGIIAVVCALVAIVGITSEKMEIIDCYQWQENARDFKHFKINKSMEYQCYSHSIDVWKYRDGIQL